MISSLLLVTITLPCHFLLAASGSRIGFLERPQNSVANPGDTVYFNCKTNASEDLIQWAHDGVLLSPLDYPAYTLSKNFLSFELGESLEDYSVQIGEYQCIGDGSLATPPAKLSIAELQDFDSRGRNTSLSVYEGNDVLIHCEIPFSNPPGFVQYYKDGVYLEKERLLNGEILFIQNIQPGVFDGNISCSVQNDITREKKFSKAFVELKVNPISDPHARNRPQVTYHPRAEYVVNLGDNYTIPCSASGYPSPPITWSKFGDSTIVLPSSHGLLDIHNASKENEGDYNCIIGGGARQFLRKTRLTVNSPPFFIDKPPYILSYRAEDSISMECRGSGSPLPRLRWYHNGLLLQNQSSNTTLFIHSVQKRHSGIYQCFIDNAAGYNQSVTHLRIYEEEEFDDEYEDDYEEYGFEDLDASTLLPPSRPNVSQLSPDSVMIFWDINTNASLSISFFKIQFREFHGKKRSNWKTLDEVIDGEQRSFELIGLHSDRRYRFRIVAVYRNLDNKPGPLSKKFKFSKRLQHSRKPKIPPVITNALPMSETSLRLGWKMRSLQDIEGYFILYRASLSKGRPFKKLTIFGGSSHSYVIEDLQPGLKYEMRVQAFNYAGVSPLSRVVRRSTSPQRKKSHKSIRPKEEEDGESNDKNNDNIEEEDEDILKEHQVRLYLLIGGTLSLLLLIFIICCSINGYLQKRRALKTYSDANVAIHEKYVDASLAQFRSAVSSRQAAPESSLHSSTHNIPPIINMETSFSNKAPHTEIPSHKELGFEEYTVEPSGSTWKRKRRSEEIL